MVRERGDGPEGRREGGGGGAIKNTQRVQTTMVSACAERVQSEWGSKRPTPPSTSAAVD